MQCFDFNKFLLTLQKSDLNESCLWKLHAASVHFVVYNLCTIFTFKTERMHFNVNLDHRKTLRMWTIMNEYSIKSTIYQYSSFHSHAHNQALPLFRQPNNDKLNLIIIQADDNDRTSFLSWRPTPMLFIHTEYYIFITKQYIFCLKCIFLLKKATIWTIFQPFQNYFIE